MELVGDTIEATVILVEDGDIRLPTIVFAAMGDGVLSETEEYPEEGGVKRFVCVEAIEASINVVSSRQLTNCRSN